MIFLHNCNCVRKICLCLSTFHREKPTKWDANKMCFNVSTTKGCLFKDRHKKQKESFRSLSVSCDYVLNK